MNIRRGLFRVWLVLSLFWIAVITAVSFSELRNDAIWGKDPRFGDEASLLLPVRCDDVRGSQGTDYVVSGAVEPWNRFRTIAEACWYRHADFRRLYPEYADLSHEIVEARLYKSLGWEQSPTARPFQKITPVALFAFIPPLIMLLGGAMIVWAVSGFSKSQPRP